MSSISYEQRRAAMRDREAGEPCFDWRQRFGIEKDLVGGVGTSVPATWPPPAGVPNVRSSLGENEAIGNIRAKSTNTKQALKKNVGRSTLFEQEAYRCHQMSRRAFPESEMEEELWRGHCPKKIDFEVEQADSRALVTNSNFGKVLMSQRM